MEILVAFIIACSNLIQPSEVGFGISKNDTISIKKECIKRVSDCGLKTFDSVGITTRESQLKCSTEVY